MKTALSFPGFIDVHVHFRDPGVPEAETTASGLVSASRGGFAAVVTMPNTTPAIDTPQMLERQLDADEGSTVLLPSACVTRGRLGREVADLEELAEAGAAFFTDDGSHVSDAHVMEAAMRRAAKLGMCICDHAMDPKEQGEGVIRDCNLARRLHLPVIPVSAETVAIKRDLSVCRVTGCKLHIQHISTAEGVSLVRNAQKEGLPVTAEATPHHIAFSCERLDADDANFKMAPPLGNDEDVGELRKAVKDGIVMFATDHAPHPASKKALGFAKSANGIIGLEAAIPVTWQTMVEEEGMSPDAWARAWWEMPRTILSPFALRRLEAIRETVVEVGERAAIDISSFASLSRNCPYDGFRSSCFPRTLTTNS
jgi:dihydroorotase